MMKNEVSNPFRTKRVFKFVFVTLLIDLIAFTLILPLLPKILDYYAKNDGSNEYKFYNDKIKMIQTLLNVPESHNQVLMAGILGSWFSFLQFVSSPFIGALSDKYGRKLVMLFTLGGSIMSYILWLISQDNFNLFILSRTIGGLSKANVGLSLAIVSDVADEASRGRGMAIVGSSFSLAFIVGPLLGAYLSTLAKAQDNLNTQLIVYPSLIATFLAIIGFLLVLFFLEETNLNRKCATLKVRSISKKQANIIAQAINYISPKSLFKFTLVENASPSQKTYLTRTGLVYFYYLLFYSGLEFTLSFLTHLRFQFSSMDQGKLYLYSGLIMASIQGGYIRRMKGGHELLMALIGLTAIIPSFIMMGFSSKVSHIYLSLTMYAISSAIVVPCLTTIASLNCPVEFKGTVMGTFRSIGSMARAIGPFVASVMFWTLGPTTCYVIGALALLYPHYLMRKLRLVQSNAAVYPLKPDRKLGDISRVADAK